MTTTADEITAIEVRLFLEAIHARYGYDLRGYSPASMTRRVLAALARAGLPSLGALQDRVLHDPAFFAAVLDHLTIQVSEMFRDPEFYRTFRARVVPLLRTYPRIRIWHCGCARGEEVYSTAIVLEEEGLYDRAQIYATDLSASAIEEAKQAVYASDQLASFTERYVRAGGAGDFARHYTSAYERFTIRESLRRNIVFFQHDLVSDQVFGEMHVVFCRNVIIYFGQELKTLAFGKLAASLRPGGFLCIGAAERLASGHQAPFVDFAPDVGIYRAPV